MNIKKSNIAILFFITFAPFLFSQNRSLADLYPEKSKDSLNILFSEHGFIQTLEKSTQKPMFEPLLDTPLYFNNIIQQRKPSFVIESARIISLKNTVSLQNIFISLSRVRDLAGRTYKSSSRGKEVPLFETATRIESPRKPTPLEDPRNTIHDVIPSKQVFYILLKDINFGNSYYKIEMQTYDKGLMFILTNAKTLSYGIIPVIGEDRFISVLYIEPLKEGLLLYNQAGAQVNSIISSQVHMPSAIRKRLDVFIDWLVDGLGQ
ncbi:DUF6675 family protein [Gracilinema caldarium]|uniref:Uncharacterized protein n=1 Tax=Gracilinema caldarium (strain ATCC 51460 / DSM 7334 / H1) TaxID=744872 RepID=F8EXN4_GRAC1|nr:DUF6675 family protein [Gracilinema caldarium]AEJ19615.1 hypothetical protein Spica_1471 [Gracilinema caldarium DSM 7334]